MIQALGMLKLFKDINENNVVKDFVFTQFKSIEEADDKGIFYIKTIADSKEDKFIKKELYNYRIWRCLVLFCLVPSVNFGESWSLKILVNNNLMQKIMPSSLLWTRYSYFFNYFLYVCFRNNKKTFSFSFGK